MVYWEEVSYIGVSVIIRENQFHKFNCKYPDLIIEARPSYIKKMWNTVLRTVINRVPFINTYLLDLSWVWQETSFNIIIIRLWNYLIIRTKSTLYWCCICSSIFVFLLLYKTFERYIHILNVKRRGYRIYNQGENTTYCKLYFLYS